MSEKNTPKYVATFTLSQQELDSPIVSSLSFDPVIQIAEDDSVPAAYFIMAELAEAYLVAAGVLDEDGAIVGDEDEIHSTVNVHVSDRFVNSTKH